MAHEKHKLEDEPPKDMVVEDRRTKRMMVGRVNGDRPLRAANLVSSIKAINPQKKKCIETERERIEGGERERQK